MTFFSNFELNIISALADQLVAAFDTLAVAPLTQASIDRLAKGQGVYQLFHNGRLVYIGKADNLPRRISEHRRKIQGRRNITVTDMGFKCLYVHKNWTALAPETSLIKHYKHNDRTVCTWNGNGFGPHDPGRERETTDKDPEGFDMLYPIREDWVCDWISAGDVGCKELLESLKAGLPYLLRYQTANSKRWRDGHPDYDRIVTVPRDNMPANELLGHVARQLPGWQATAFPSHMILYHEDHRYRHGVRL